MSIRISLLRAHERVDVLLALQQLRFVRLDDCRKLAVPAQTAGWYCMVENG